VFVTEVTIRRDHVVLRAGPSREDRSMLMTVATAATREVTMHTIARSMQADHLQSVTGLIQDHVLAHEESAEVAAAVMRSRARAALDHKGRNSRESGWRRSLDVVKFNLVQQMILCVL